MIIYGSRGIDSVREKTNFFCPDCNGNCPATLKEVKRYFTLYFIPLFPIGSAGIYVECDTCASQYDQEILNYSQQKNELITAERTLRIMIMAALADDEVDEGERKAINEHYAKLTGMPVPPSELETEINMARQANVTLNDFVQNFAHELSDPEKGAVVKAAFHVMTGAGSLKPGHKKQLSQLANTLGIPKNHFMDLLKRTNT